MDRSTDYFERAKERDRDIVCSHSLGETIDRLRELNLLQSRTPTCNSDQCEGQNIRMRVQIDQSRLDGQNFRCSSCNSKRAMRFRSIFQDTRVPIGCLYRLFLAFIQEMTNEEGMEYADCSIKTLRSVFRYLRRSIATAVDQERQGMQLTEVNGVLRGGIEMDESLFTHIVELGDDRVSQQVWVFGMIERNTNRFICYVLGNTASKTTQNIRPLIARHVQTNQNNPTQIYTDGAMIYSYLQNEHYAHTVVVHQNGFGEGDNTTNHTEALWARLKGAGRFKKSKNFKTLTAVQDEIDLITWMVQTPKATRLTVLSQICARNYQQSQLKIIDQ
ncbi:hypothetical protein ABPG72_022846 [Tetrahymena utriculariae]